jgi:hypothetical protein
MKVCPDTIEILKNFSGINPSILITTNKQLSTIAESRNVVAVAKVPEKFDKEFGIFDLNEFLATLDLFSDPSFDLNENYLSIKDDIKENKASCKYFFADNSMVPEPPNTEKILKGLKSAEIKFTLTETIFNKLLKAAGTLQSKFLVVESDGKKILISAADPENNTANTYSIEVAKGNGSKFKMIFKTSNLTSLAKGDYDIQISSQKISQFKNTSKDLMYFVALEDLSSYSS